MIETNRERPPKLPSSCFHRKVLITFLTKSTLNKNDTFYDIWLWIITAAFFYNVLFTPLRAAFSDFNLEHIKIWFALDYTCDLIYLIDMIVKSRTRFYQQGNEIYELKVLRNSYMRSSAFILDILSIFPTDLAYVGIGPAYVIVRLNRFLRFQRFVETTSRVESTATFPNLFRFAVTVFVFILPVHYIAILYYAYSKGIGFSKNEDEFGIPKSSAQSPFITVYAKCIYWSFMTFAFIGEQPVPKTIDQQLIYCALWILGLTMFGYVVGRLGEILRNTAAANDSFNNNLDGIRSYLASQNIPGKMTDKVVKWFGYAYQISALTDSDKSMESLPNKLVTDIAMDIHLADIRKVKLFADLEMPALTEIVRRLKLTLFSPGDYICKKGDIGREMFVIKRGYVEVISDDAKMVFVTLGPGTVFGEISLLSIPGSLTGNKRTANVRCKGYCSLYSLSKDDLYDVLQDFPGALQKLVEKGQDVLRKENKIDENLIANKELEEIYIQNQLYSMKSKLDATESTIAFLLSSIRYSHSLAHQRLDIIERLIAPFYGRSGGSEGLGDEEREYHSDSEADISEFNRVAEERYQTRSVEPETLQKKAWMMMPHFMEEIADEAASNWSMTSTYDAEETVDPRHLILRQRHNDYGISIKVTPASPQPSLKGSSFVSRFRRK